MMYDPGYTRNFYNKYGLNEWQRLERSPYGRLQAIIHNDFIKRYVKSNDRVLDVGCGPGHFTISLARLGAKKTALDLAEGQLELAKQKSTEAGVIDRVEDFVQADITYLSMYQDQSFDVVVCYGGALSYVCEKRQEAADELKRVVKKGGLLLLSVMSLGGVRNITNSPQIDVLESPDKTVNGNPPLWEVLATGDLPGFPSRSKNLMHAPMHMFRTEELRELFYECKVLEIVGSNVTINEFAPASNEIAASPAAWATLVEMERQFCTDPGLISSGTHIIMVACR